MLDPEDFQDPRVTEGIRVRSIKMDRPLENLANQDNQDPRDSKEIQGFQVPKTL